MRYFLNNSKGKKKLHTEKCYTYEIHGEGGIKSKTWIKFNTLEEAQEYCRKAKRKYRYCGRCMKEYGKKVVK